MTRSRAGFKMLTYDPKLDRSPTRAKTVEYTLLLGANNETQCNCHGSCHG